MDDLGPQLLVSLYDRQFSHEDHCYECSEERLQDADGGVEGQKWVICFIGGVGDGSVHFLGLFEDIAEHDASCVWGQVPIN